MEAEKPRDVMQSFQEVCDQFSALSKSDQGDAVPVYGGFLQLFTYFLRRPIHSYIKIIRVGFRSQARINALGVFFPVAQMVGYLNKFSEAELGSLKKISQINVRTQKDQLTNNPIFKYITLPVGSAYAVLKVGSELTGRSAGFSLVKSILASESMQTFLDALLGWLAVFFIVLAAQYLFVFLPRLQRAQLLDDMIQISLENRRFRAKQPATSSLTESPDQS